MSTRTQCSDEEEEFSEWVEGVKEKLLSLELQTQVQALEEAQTPARRYWMSGMVPYIVSEKKSGYMLYTLTRETLNFIDE